MNICAWQNTQFIFTLLTHHVIITNLWFNIILVPWAEMIIQKYTACVINMETDTIYKAPLYEYILYLNISLFEHSFNWIFHSKTFIFTTQNQYFVLVTIVTKYRWTFTIQSSTVTCSGNPCCDIITQLCLWEQTTVHEKAMIN